MKQATIAILMLIGALAAHSNGAEGALKKGTSHHPAVEDRLEFTLHLPNKLVGKPAPLLVLLSEVGFTDRDWATLAMAYATEGRYVVLCPRPGGLGFTDSDLDPLIRTVEHVKGRLASESVHLLGMRDSARQAILFAFARPKTFRSVVAVGADVPRVRPPSAARSLRVLLLKAAADRPAAGRESIVRIREHVEVADFREMIGDPRMPDPASRRYVIHFIDAAAGRATPGRDLSLQWRALPAGLAERLRRKSKALVYLFDDSAAGQARTRRIQNDVLFDQKLREAMKGVVPIMAHRQDAAKIRPNFRIKSGPALIVLDEEGKVVGVLQGRLTASALLALLKS